MTLLYCDIGGDQVVLRANDETRTIALRGLEDVLPAQLREMIQTHDIDTVICRNGPGSFTMLRVATLIINLVAQYLPRLRILTIDKLALYTLLYQRGWLSQHGIVRVGQKNNAARYDCATGDRVVESLATLCDGLSGVSPGAWWCESYGRVTEMADEGSSICRVRIAPCVDGIMLHNDQSGQSQTMTRDELLEHATCVERLEPYYLLEPSITPPKSENV